MNDWNGALSVPVLSCKSDATDFGGGVIRRWKMMNLLGDDQPKRIANEGCQIKPCPMG